MITLPHHVEFLSDAWLDEARALPRARGRARARTLGGGRSRSASAFTDAPPHLKLPDNVGAWTVRYDGETSRSRAASTPAPTWWSRATTRRR